MPRTLLLRGTKKKLPLAVLSAKVPSYMFKVLVCETVPEHLHGYLSRF